MTIFEAYRWNRTRVAAIEQRLAELDEEVTAEIEQATGDAVKRAVARYNRERDRLRAALWTAKAEALSAEAAVTQHIDRLEDKQTALILTLRYIHGMEWVRIALEVGGKATPDSVKKRAERAIKAMEKQ